jgi:hypothetical protein
MNAQETVLDKKEDTRLFSSLVSPFTPSSLSCSLSLSSYLPLVLKFPESFPVIQGMIGGYYFVFASSSCTFLFRDRETRVSLYSIVSLWSSFVVERSLIVARSTLRSLTSFPRPFFFVFFVSQSLVSWISMYVFLQFLQSGWLNLKMLLSFAAKRP